MKPVFWIILGIPIAVLARIPINLTDPGDIPFGAAILGMLGTIVGAIIVPVAVVQWARRSARRA
jgi:hypothetical protein